MGNTYFQFKKFRIEQSEAAMKVCTDSCLLGAYASHPSPNNILDIGTGTGLLALMLAQKYPKAKITALEPHLPSYEQALLNFKNSPWEKNLKLHPQRLQEFILSCDQQFDLIVCNPPFYPAQRKNPDLNKAAHSFDLPMSELIKAVLKLSNAQGKSYLLYPPDTGVHLQKMAKKAGLSIKESLCLKNKEMVTCFRLITVLSKEPSPTSENEIVIRINGNYSPEFINLMKGYYLFL